MARVFIFSMLPLSTTTLTPSEVFSVVADLHRFDWQPIYKHTASVLGASELVEWSKNKEKGFIFAIDLKWKELL